MTEYATIAEGDITELNRRFTLDELDDWHTTAGLAESALDMIANRIPGARASLFFHVKEAREYREIDREGLAAIPEDSLFIACLAMQETGIKVESVFSEYVLDDPLLQELLTGAYGGCWITPVVHRFSLLAFLLIALDRDERGNLPIDQPTENEKTFLKDLTNRLKTNLYAASIADERQRELLKLAEYPITLHKRESVQDLVENLLKDISSEIRFDTGIYYQFDEYHQKLIPLVWTGISGLPPVLNAGRGISGLTIERKRATYVPDRAKHPSFSAMEEEIFIQGSFVSAPIYTEKRTIGVVTLSRKPEAKEAFGVEHRYTVEIAASFIATEINNRLLYDELEQSYFATVSSLTRALEAKDRYTRGHSERVMEYAVGIAKTLDLSLDSVRKIRYAAILHDIGKIGVSDSIITKPSTLTELEFAEIKKHTEIGYDIITESSFFGDIRDLIRYHHEKMDGTGYNSMMSGDYPWEAMIISLADIYDALVSDRPYRRAFSASEAMKSLERLVDVNFDTRIFEAFKEYLTKTKRMPPIDKS